MENMSLDIDIPEDMFAEVDDAGPFDERVNVETAEPPNSPETIETPASFCVAFRGINGGAGVTSLAVQTAHAFSQAGRGDVCLVDLDFSLGMCAHYLDIGIVPDVNDFQVDPARMDRSYLQAMLAHHEAGFSVLGSPGALGGNDDVNPATVLRMLDLVSEMFPIIVLDVPRMSRPWTDAAMLAADRTCLVTELNIPALHMSRLRLDELRTRGVADPQVILSKYEKRSFKACIRQNDAERALGQEVIGVIGMDAHAPSEAMNCGEPAGRIQGESRFVKDVGQLVRALSPQFSERRRKRSVLGRLARGRA